jgi:hypothetical protein
MSVNSAWQPQSDTSGRYRTWRGRQPNARFAAGARATCAHGARRASAITEAQVREALERLDPLWDELFAAEQARIVQLLVERVDISQEGADIRLPTEGLAMLLEDLRATKPGSRRVA